MTVVQDRALVVEAKLRKMLLNGVSGPFNERNVVDQGLLSHQFVCSVHRWPDVMRPCDKQLVQCKKLCWCNVNVPRGPSTCNCLSSERVTRPSLSCGQELAFTASERGVAGGAQILNTVHVLCVI